MVCSAVVIRQEYKEESDTSKKVISYDSSPQFFDPNF